jgi:hypothetical protein
MRVTALQEDLMALLGVKFGREARQLVAANG